MLHIVNKSPFENNAFSTCMQYAQAGSAVLLIEDGIYAALQGTSFAANLAEILGSGVSFYVLGPDMSARGMQNKPLIEGVSVVDYAGFVDLVAANNTAQSWL
jgi:tRNA 2-thiouridine synthesizing protein B